MNKLKLIVLVCIACFPVYIAAQVTGCVFDDVNKNGIKDGNEKGIAGVVVSNEYDFVKTNKEGKFSIEPKGRFIFVVKPEGYKATFTLNSVPQLYAATEKSNTTPILFSLTKVNEQKNFTMLAVGDPQVKGNRLYYYKEEIITPMMSEKADFAVLLGDIADDDLSIYPEEIEMTKQLPYPVYRVFGNHDVYAQAVDSKGADSTFTSYYGPSCIAYNYGDVHFVNVNNINYKGWNREAGKKGDYFGGMGQQQLEWLKNDLSYVPKNKLIVLMMHIPLLKEYSYVEDVDSLFTMLKDRPHLLAINGHLHTMENYLFTTNDRWLGNAEFRNINVGAACGSWWSGPLDDRQLPNVKSMDGSPNGYYRFNFTGSTYTYKFISAYAKEEQMRITLDCDTIAFDQVKHEVVTINGFAFPIEAQVEVRFDDELNTIATRFEGYDPLVQKTLNLRKNDDRWSPALARTKHLWKVNIPSNLHVGTHRVYVKATYKNVVIAEGYKLFVISN